MTTTNMQGLKKRVSIGASSLRVAIPHCKIMSLTVSLLLFPYPSIMRSSNGWFLSRGIPFLLGSHFAVIGFLAKIVLTERALHDAFPTGYRTTGESESWIVCIRIFSRSIGRYNAFNPWLSWLESLPMFKLSSRPLSSLDKSTLTPI